MQLLCILLPKEKTNKQTFQKIPLHNMHDQETGSSLKKIPEYGYVGQLKDQVQQKQLEQEELL